MSTISRNSRRAIVTFSRKQDTTELQTRLQRVFYKGRLLDPRLPFRQLVIRSRSSQNERYLMLESQVEAVHDGFNEIFQALSFFLKRPAIESSDTLRNLQRLVLVRLRKNTTSQFLMLLDLLYTSRIIHGEGPRRVLLKYLDLKDSARLPFLDLRQSGLDLIPFAQCWARIRSQKSDPIFLRPALQHKLFTDLRHSSLRLGKYSEEFSEISIRLNGDAFVNEFHYLTRPLAKYCTLARNVSEDAKDFFNRGPVPSNSSRFFRVRHRGLKGLPGELERLIDVRLSTWQETWEAHNADPDFPKPPLYSMGLPAPDMEDIKKRIKEMLMHLDGHEKILRLLRRETLTYLKKLRGGNQTSPGRFKVRSYMRDFDRPFTQTWGQVFPISQHTHVGDLPILVSNS